MHNITSRVYLVEDHAAMAHRVADMVAECGGEVVGLANTVQQSRQELEAVSPDCVVLDFALPDGSALDVLKVIAKLEHRPVVIVLSNHPYYASACRTAGADWFFDKSQELRSFTQTLRLLSTPDANQGHEDECLFG